MSFIIKRNDLQPVLSRTLVANGNASSPIDLTGCTVWFILSPAAGGSPKVQAQAVVDDATAGKVHYTWAAGDTDTAGTYKAEWEILNGSGQPRTVPENDYDYVTITPDLGGAGTVLPPAPTATVVLLQGVPTPGQVPKYAGSGIANWANESAAGIVSRALGGFGADTSASIGIPVLASGSVSYVTPPAGAIVGTTDTQTLTGKTIDGGSNAFTNVPTSALTGSISVGAISGLPAFPAGAVVGASDAQTLTNKTISGASNTLSNIGLASLTGLASGMAAFLATPSSANLAATVTDETGTGALVFANTPTLVTPVLGAASGTSLALGANPAATGVIALANNTSINVRNAANSADLALLGINSSNQIVLGSSTAGYGNLNISTCTGTSILLNVAGGTVMTVGSGAISLTGILTQNFNAIAAVSTDGTVVRNTTAATLGVPVQYSPRLRLSGAAYNSTSTLSEANDWISEVRPASAAGATSSVLAFARQVNGGGYADVVGFNSANSGALAQSGTMRTPNVFSITNRNSGATADLTIAEANANNLYLGMASSFSGTSQFAATYLMASTSLNLLINGATMLKLQSGFGSIGVAATNLSLFSATGSFGGGSGGMLFVANASTVPTSNPTGGGVVYVEAGALKYRGSSGTITILGPA